MPGEDTSAPVPERGAPGEPGGPPARSMLQTGERLLSWFIEGPVRADPEEARRARLVVVAALVFVVIAVLVLVFTGFTSTTVELGGVPLPRPSVAGVLFLIPVNLSLAFIVKRTQTAGRAAVLLPFSLVVMIAFFAAFGGGYASPVLWWLTAVPLFGAFLSGRLGAGFAAAVSFAVLLGFYYLDATAGVMALDPAPTESLSAANRLRAQVTMLGAVTFLGWDYERTRMERARSLVSALEHLEGAYRALRVSQHNLTQIADNIGQAIWMEEDGEAGPHVVYANVGFEALFGRPRDALVGDPKAWTAHIEHSDRPLAPRNPTGLDHVYRVTLPGEDTTWVRHAIFQAPEGDGAPPRRIHIAADITDKKLAEELRARFIETVLEVQEAERKHLARELHDDTGQSLTALLVGLRTLESLIPDAAQQEFVGQLRDQTRSVVDDIRRLARGLHPQVLDDMGLVAALQRLGRDAAEASGLRIPVHVRGIDNDTPLPPAVKLTLYRVAQEALNNALRHAEADRIDIDLTRDAQGVHLRVEDDGRGFEVSVPKRARELAGGLGLFSMRERASMLGGEVSIESAPGRGTTVIASLPLDDGEDT